MPSLRGVGGARVNPSRKSHFTYLLRRTLSETNLSRMCLPFKAKFGKCFADSLSTSCDRMMRHFQYQTYASLLLLLVSTQCWASVQLKLVAPGIYVVLQPFADRFNDSKSTVVVMDDGHRPRRGPHTIRVPDNLLRSSGGFNRRIISQVV